MLRDCLKVLFLDLTYAPSNARIETQSREASKAIVDPYKAFGMLA